MHGTPNYRTSKADKMTERVVEIIIQEVRQNRTHIMDIIERLVRVEEKTTRKATIYGIVGGVLPSLTIVLWWLFTTRLAH